MFTKQDIKDYYKQTINHYETWWQLGDHLSLHYGITDEKNKSFGDSLNNTNRVFLDLAQIKSTDKVLDAGCGVGGAAIFINQQTGAEVTGISLSEVQIDYASRAARAKNLSKVNFEVMDYLETSFEDNSLDVVWACESSCHTHDKKDFIREMYRMLKPAGKLIMSDFFILQEDQQDPKSYIKKWIDTWGVPNLAVFDTFTRDLKDFGFSTVEAHDYTQGIWKSAKRMYHAALLGAIPSELYNLLHPEVTHFAKSHYKCGYYQYKALTKGLWEYHVILATK